MESKYCDIERIESLATLVIALVLCGLAYMPYFKPVFTLDYLISAIILLVSSFVMSFIHMNTRKEGCKYDIFDIVLDLAISFGLYTIASYWSVGRRFLVYFLLLYIAIIATVVLLSIVLRPVSWDSCKFIISSITSSGMVVVIIVCCSGLIMDVNSDQTARDDTDGLDVIMLLRDEEWIGLSEDQELEVLQVIANQTDYTAGITDYAQVVIGDLSYPVVGSYDPETNEIVIDREIFETSDQWELVRIVLHEGHHHVTYTLSEAYDSLPEEYRGLEYFSALRTYYYEYHNYINDDQDLYRRQSVEQDAEDWALRQTLAYRELVELQSFEEV